MLGTTQGGLTVGSAAESFGQGGLLANVDRRLLILQCKKGRSHQIKGTFSRDFALHCWELMNRAVVD